MSQNYPVRTAPIMVGAAALLGISMVQEAPAADDFERVPEAEAAQIDETARLTVELQTMRRDNDSAQQGRILRGVHTKAHGCVRAAFTVNKGIDEPHRVGVFAQPGRTFDAWIRYSNASVLLEDDLKADDNGVRQNGSRGMAIKVMGVDGEILQADGGEHNQDFLMINTPRFVFPDVRSYHRLTKVLERSKPKGDSVGEFFLPLALAQAGKAPPEGDLWAGFEPADLASTKLSLGILRAEVQAAPVRNPLEVAYFGAASFLFGPDRAMKFSAQPCKAVEQMAFSDDEKKTLSKDYLAETLARTMHGSESICYEFKIQTRAKAELDESAIAEGFENVASMWPNELANYRTVASIEIPAPQQTDTAEAREHCEKLAFTPWHSLVDHRPIGGINRLRQSVYSNSAKARDADGY